jgi:hypothetical protein
MSTITNSFEEFKAAQPYLFDITTIKPRPELAHYLEERLFAAFNVGAAVGRDQAREEMKSGILKVFFPDDSI